MRGDQNGQDNSYVSKTSGVRSPAGSAAESWRWPPPRGLMQSESTWCAFPEIPERVFLQNNTWSLFITKLFYLSAENSGMEEYLCLNLKPTGAIAPSAPARKPTATVYYLLWLLSSLLLLLLCLLLTLNLEMSL